METIAPILEIIRTLRGENGCAWDRNQTPLTMWKCLAEEVYELQEGLVKKDRLNICEELGDVLFQVVFIMEIFHEAGEIPIDQVVDRVAQKMIRRHPHVYDTAVVNTEEELHRQWEEIKTLEKAENSAKPEKGRPSALDSVPQGMPGLLRAMKVSKCAVKEGFDWENIQGVLDQVKEEIQEFETALKQGDLDETALEFGDILFSLVNVARFAGFHPETALGQSTSKFETRFRLMETMLAKDGVTLKSLSQEDKDAYWDRAKEKEKRS
ncbi:nucleoside triphosphate pyrophosphohydrolase [Desulfospira joergensenii]|uniref:nucleoside triphosphate pyrophosphohydrolase n=1 Tax=Desulfospira joergensenii TaxID=53329 RepID=UPI0003B575F6|nr:nucleoside triphosphate pyrophosphohydrolase [Desulfospira joergensenii]